MTNWPTVPLGLLLRPAGEQVKVRQDLKYPNFGMYSFARGLFEKRPIDGAATSASVLHRVRSGNFIYSRLFAFEGAYGIVDESMDGYYVSNEYPSFEIDATRLLPGFLKVYFKMPAVWQAIARNSKGVGSRRIRVHPDRVLEHQLSLPPLVEQHALVGRISALSDKTEQLTAHLDAIEAAAEHLLALRFRDAIADAHYCSMSEVAPVMRRQVVLDLEKTYREVGARSFGRGLFAKPDFDAAQATWQKPIWIEADDLVFSNIKAWEGAIALADETHDGCIASHRYITCVPDQRQILGRFLLYYLLSDDGLERVGTASPGTADRNRTLSLGNLAKIKVPVPTLSSQEKFVALQATVTALKTRHGGIREDSAALLPSTLERLFAAEDRSP